MDDRLRQRIRAGCVSGDPNEQGRAWTDMLRHAAPCTACNGDRVVRAPRGKDGRPLDGTRDEWCGPCAGFGSRVAGLVSLLAYAGDAGALAAVGKCSCGQGMGYEPGHPAHFLRDDYGNKRDDVAWLRDLQRFGVLGPPGLSLSSGLTIQQLQARIRAWARAQLERPQIS